MFVGRQADLRQLARHLKHLHSGEAVAITSLGGMGKSQLAVELAHRYSSYFPGGVFWLSLAEESNIPVDTAPPVSPLHPQPANRYRPRRSPGGGGTGHDYRRL
jgi:hypothetical protein